MANRQLRSTVVDPQQTGGVNNESVFYAYLLHSISLHTSTILRLKWLTFTIRFECTTRMT